VLGHQIAFCNDSEIQKAAEPGNCHQFATFCVGVCRQPMHF